MEDDFDIMEDDIVMMEDDHCYFLINQGRLNPFKFSEMIGNYKGKMLDEFSRLEDDLQQPLEDDLQTTEDDTQTNKDDLDIMEDDQRLLFPFN